jgi:vacuolar-type H+-ATPase subunit F/Vma7
MPATNKVAVLGDADFVMPFSALGVDTFATEQTRGKIAENAKKTIEGKYALIIVAENIAPAVEEIFSAYQDTPTPCIVVVPFTTEPTGIATRALGKALKMATGINILQNN